MGLRKLMLFSSVAVCLSSCGATFGYKYYTIVPSQGKLFGEKPSDDIDIKMCEPDANDKAKCYAMLASEFEKLKLEHKKLIESLIDCQKPRHGD